MKTYEVQGMVTCPAIWFLEIDDEEDPWDRADKMHLDLMINHREIVDMEAIDIREVENIHE